MSTADRYDEHRHDHWRRPSLQIHPAWIVLLVLGFIVWWPIGLAILAYTFWSRTWVVAAARIGSTRCSAWKRKWAACAIACRASAHPGAATSSGNHAFDEYRSETLRRLEEEQREFRDFLDRLRFAKDKSEFDQFMADRRNRPQPQAPQPPSPQPQS